ncbi:hypothetical protein BDN71DRAFT_1428706 [Pleurotus eryngii]|uniref:Uncharacterized protein n=1 Tax=Pleurotus eryngii TaxID=5323 RepID=A0A9P6A3K3_PLEER|nr:hypothetical protein BDN71DRAFT_1428706 [Pleurotus eryngii]
MAVTKMLVDLRFEYRRYGGHWALVRGEERVVVLWCGSPKAIQFGASAKLASEQLAGEPSCTKKCWLRANLFNIQHPVLVMARKKNSVIVAAAQMHKAKVTQNQTKLTVKDSSSTSDTELDVDMCYWDGSVNHVLLSDEEPIGFDTNTEEFSDLDGEELVASIKEEMKQKGIPLLLVIIMQSARNIEVWSSAERNCALEYNGNSKWTKQHHMQKA